MFKQWLGDTSIFFIISIMEATVKGGVLISQGIKLWKISWVVGIFKDSDWEYNGCRKHGAIDGQLKEIVETELQKLLDDGFIYPTSNSQWVSPLVIMPKKGVKWRVCMNFRDLNNATKNDNFPFPFVDQVLDSLSRKRYFSFLDGYSGYNQIRISPEEREKMTLTCPWGNFAYSILPFG